MKDFTKKTFADKNYFIETRLCSLQCVKIKGDQYFLKSITLNKYFAEPYKNYVQAIKIKKNDIVLKNLIEIIDQNKVPEAD